MWLQKLPIAYTDLGRLTSEVQLYGSKTKEDFWWPADMRLQRTASNQQDRPWEFDYYYRESYIKPPPP